TGLARLPARTGWLDITALALLGGVGFTVSLLIADLGLPDDVREPAKAAVLLGSLVASLLAALMLSRRSRSHRKRAAEARSEEHTSELQSRENLVCRLLLEKKNNPDPAEEIYDPHL